MKLPLNSPSRLPGPSRSQSEKVHGKSEERYNFGNFPSLCAKLHARNDPASAYIWQHFSTTTKAILANILGSTRPPSRTESEMVVRGLNDILCTDSLYASGIAPEALLSERTEQLARLNPQGRDLVRLNRYILEDLYPLEITPLTATSRFADASTIIETFGKLFPIALAVVYASGFLIVSMFLDRFGITEANAEFLKISYLQVGFHYLAFPLFVLIPVFIFFRLQNDPHARTRMPTIAIFGMVNLLFTFYWFATFAQPGDFYAKRRLIGLLFLLTVTLIVSGRRLALRETSDFTWIDDLAAAFVDPFFSKHKKITQMNVMRGLFAVTLLVFDVLILGNLGKAIAIIGLSLFGCVQLGDWLGKRQSTREERTRWQFAMAACVCVGTILAIMACRLFTWDRAEHLAFYYIYWGIVLGFLWKELKSIRARYNRRERIFVWSLRACIMGALYYMGVLAFSYGVYPNIPVAKGGGNYTHASDVRLYIGSDTASALPANIVERTVSRIKIGDKDHTNVVARTKRVKIIYATPSTLYLADPLEPVATGGLDGWSEWHIPNVVALKRDAIVSVIHIESGLASLSQAQVAQAVKEALTNGVQRAIKELGHDGGFLTNLNARLVMPDVLQGVETSVRQLHQGQVVDELVTNMNRAAEQALFATGSVFLDAISRMSLGNAKVLVAGSDEAATQYFRKATETNLVKILFPVMKVETEKAGVTASYRRVEEIIRTNLLSVGSGTPLKQAWVDMDEYVANRAMEQVFIIMAAEEQRIRQDETRRTTDGLRRVFGAVSE